MLTNYSSMHSSSWSGCTIKKRPSKATTSQPSPPLNPPSLKPNYKLTNNFTIYYKLTTHVHPSQRPAPAPLPVSTTSSVRNESSPATQNHCPSLASESQTLRASPLVSTPPSDPHHLCPTLKDPLLSGQSIDPCL